MLCANKTTVREVRGRPNDATRQQVAEENGPETSDPIPGYPSGEDITPTCLPEDSIIGTAERSRSGIGILVQQSV